jgi:hypothetical protein
VYQLLYYNGLHYNELEKQFNKVISFLQAGDFKSADVKKLKPSKYFRAKLDISNRLLFKIIHYKQQAYILILEVIRNHEYAKSRFLQGAKITEEDILSDRVIEEDQESLDVLSKNHNVHLLNKFIVFDEQQEDILNCSLPIILIGSAGSGKTSVSLTKLRQIEGKILYISLSNYLVSNAQKSYFAFNYLNEQQDINFLSFYEFIETIKIPSGQAITEGIFLKWFTKQNLPKHYGVGDGRELFEEFMGVITGSVLDEPYLSREEYQNLGIKQSIFSFEQRKGIYDLFQKYLQFLKEENYYDTNVISSQYTNLVEPIYDAIIVDEVQDFTNSQLFLVLKSLKKQGQFLLCGDANQIIHPNFFSWSKLKSFFYTDNNFIEDKITKILTANYRNTPEVTELANRVLKFKNYYFGSVDKESHYLIKSTSEKHGTVNCLQDKIDIIKEVNIKTSKSTNYAILVLHEHHKDKARELFRSPLIFTVQEAKGLEYDNIIIYNFVSNEKNYTDITKGADRSFLDADFKYARVKDKTDKSLEIYKFYINALYVAITRSVCNVYIIESNASHKFLRLLEINEIQEINIEAAESSREAWQKEANKLIMQGKDEQAKAIETNILQHQNITWTPIDQGEFKHLYEKVINQKTADKRECIKLLNYSIIYSDLALIKQLQTYGLKAAANISKCIPLMLDEYFNDYLYQSTTNLLKKLDSFGTEFRNEFNLTPLMSAAYAGKKSYVDMLISLGASINATDNNHRNAFMIAISRASDDQKYCNSVFEKIYQQLKPDAIMLKINNRLVKIESYKSEYFFLYFLITKIKNASTYKDNQSKTVFKAVSVSALLKDFPESVLPKYRQNRNYVSALFARNEVHSNYPYNKQLFSRIAIGVYTISPDIEIKICDMWSKL